MPTIAQKLCNEIVEPGLTPSITNNRIINSGLMPHNPSKTNGKTTRTIVVEKKKVINKLTPHKSDSSKTVVNKLKSKETFLRKVLVDISTNTLITGPLRCDNDCVTMVRKRDNSCSCKCSHKRHCNKGSAKQIQTIDSKNHAFMDKACTRCIETISCGTQFLDRLNGTLKVPDSSRTMMKAKKDVISSDIIRQSMKMRQETSSSSYKPPNMSYSYITGKRWALSQYPTRGPDF